MQFTLNINGEGNAAMRTADDVSRALEKIARRLRNRDWEEFAETILDDNGNSVGTWELAGAGVAEDGE